METMELLLFLAFKYGYLARAEIDSLPDEAVKEDYEKWKQGTIGMITFAMAEQYRRY